MTLSDVCDVAELIVARSIERQLMVDRQVAVELALRGLAAEIPRWTDVDDVIDVWLRGDVSADEADVDVDRLVLLEALGVRS